MADKRITQLDASAGLVSTDIIPVVDDPGGTPVTQKATIQQVAEAVQAIFDAVPTYDATGSAASAQSAALASSVLIDNYTAKGDLVVGASALSGDLATISVGANNTFLVADSGSTGGLKYVPIANDQSVLSSQIFG